MVHFIEMIKEDVNQNDGVIISLFTKVTAFLFKSVVFLAIPLFFYFLITIF